MCAEHTHTHILHVVAVWLVVICLPIDYSFCGLIWRIINWYHRTIQTNDYLSVESSVVVAPISALIIIKHDKNMRNDNISRLVQRTSIFGTGQNGQNQCFMAKSSIKTLIQCFLDARALKPVSMIFACCGTNAKNHYSLAIKRFSMIKWDICV